MNKCEHKNKDAYIIDNGMYVVTIVFCIDCGAVLSEHRELKQ